ncbi:MAG: Dna2/Cas4 domain-containing protein [Flavobacteriales bacterium]
MSFSISKSGFIKGLQCSRQLYLHYQHPTWRDPITPREKALFKRGVNIGQLAHKIFPGGHSADSTGSYAEWFEKTKSLLQAGHATIFEAAFKNDFQMAAIDILEFKNDAWNAWEVKSLLHINETHVNDLAFQYHTIRNCGIDISKAGIIHLNPHYIRQGALDLHQLFMQQDVSDMVMLYSDRVAAQLEEMHEILNENKMPRVKPGKHCIEPYSCAFMRYCWDSFAKNTNQTLKNDIKTVLIEKGIITAEQSEKKAETSVIFEKDAILYLRLGVPWFQGTKPYQPIPFIKFEAQKKIVLQNSWKHGEIDFELSTASENKLDIHATLNSMELHSLKIILNEKFSDLATCENTIEQQYIIAEIETIIQQ